MTFRNGQYEGNGKDDWTTPPDLIVKLTEEYGELYDPCPSGHVYGLSYDALEEDWPTDKYCFVNPPYSEINAWSKKCKEQWLRGCNIILLIPSRTDTKYFHANIYGYAEIRFIKGRLKFGRPFGRRGIPIRSAPFPSMLCIYDREGYERYLNHTTNRMQQVSE